MWGAGRAGIVGAGAHSCDDGLADLLVHLHLGLGLHHQGTVAHQLAALIGITLAGASGTDRDLALDRAGGALHDTLRLIVIFDHAERAYAAADIALNALIRNTYIFLAVLFSGNDRSDGAVLHANAALLAQVLLNSQHGPHPPCFHSNHCGSPRVLPFILGYCNLMPKTNIKKIRFKPLSFKKR